MGARGYIGPVPALARGLNKFELGGILRLPSLREVKLGAREARRVYPGWPLAACVARGYTVAVDGLNPSNGRVLFEPASMEA